MLYRLFSTTYEHGNASIEFDGYLVLNSFVQSILCVGLAALIVGALSTTSRTGDDTWLAARMITFTILTVVACHSHVHTYYPPTESNSCIFIVQILPKIFD
jgi:hypothetical protein